MVKFLVGQVASRSPTSGMPLASAVLGAVCFAGRCFFIFKILNVFRSPGEVNGAAIRPSGCAARRRFIPNNSKCPFYSSLSCAPSLTVAPEWSSLSLTHLTCFLIDVNVFEIRLERPKLLDVLH